MNSPPLLQALKLKKAMHLAIDFFGLSEKVHFIYLCFWQYSSLSFFLIKGRQG